MDTVVLKQQVVDFNRYSEGASASASVSPMGLQWHWLQPMDFEFCLGLRKTIG
jgi:hypothetical protein